MAANVLLFRLNKKRKMTQLAKGLNQTTQVIPMKNHLKWQLQFRFPGAAGILLCVGFCSLSISFTCLRDE